MRSRAVQLLLHALAYSIPVAFMFGMAAGKAREDAAYRQLIERMPIACQERMARLD